FYDKKLLSATERQKSVLSNSYHLPKILKDDREYNERVIFISTPISSELSTPTNPYEAKIVIELIKTLRSQFPQYSIGVITPYRSQIALIKSLLDKTINDITIDTVERYQGSER